MNDNQFHCSYVAKMHDARGDTVRVRVLPVRFVELTVQQRDELNQSPDNPQTAYLNAEMAHQLADKLYRASNEVSRRWQATPKPLRDFLQLDGWAHIEPGDYVMVPDDDGDVLTGGRRLEPQRSDTTVRTYIAANAAKEDVMRILRKQLEWFERDGMTIAADPEPPF